MVPKLTNNGINLMVRAIAGEEIIFTRISIGDGDVPGDYKSLTSLQHEVADMEIDELLAEEQYVTLKASMTNADFGGGFYWTELGVYAQNPDGGDDILYAYAHYIITGDDAATYIPAATSSLVEITHIVHVFVGDLENVTALLTKHSEFASAEELKKHLNAENPHRIDKKAVGLGLIVNATPENQKPIFGEGNSAYSIDGDGKLTFANIFSGEKVGSILQKVRTFISLVVTHMNDKNPHNLTPSDIKASSEEHKHSAASLTGTLPISKGGTGEMDGAKALKAFFESGPTVLSHHQYGHVLPDPGVPGRIFFLVVDE